MLAILGSLTGLTSKNDDDAEEEEPAYEPTAKKQKSSVAGTTETR